MATDAERNRGAGAYSTPGVDTHSNLAPSQIITSAPIIGFKVHGVDPPAGLYVLSNMAIRIFCWNTIANFPLGLSGRVLRADGVVSPFKQIFFPTSNRALNTFFWQLPEGYLLSLALGGNVPGITRGAIYAEAGLNVGLGPGANAVAELCGDYINGGTGPFWPTGRIIQGSEGQGNLRSIVGTTPAAGAEITEVVPANARWRVQTINFVLTTSAAVANRDVSVAIDDGVNIIFQIGAPAVQAAGVSDGYHVAQGLPLSTGILGDGTMPLPNALVMMPGWRIRTITNNIQAADQYGSPKYSVEEWLETD